MDPLLVLHHHHHHHHHRGLLSCSRVEEVSDGQVEAPLLGGACRQQLPQVSEDQVLQACWPGASQSNGFWEFSSVRQRGERVAVMKGLNLVHVQTGSDVTADKIHNCVLILQLFAVCVCVCVRVYVRVYVRVRVCYLVSLQLCLLWPCCPVMGGRWRLPGALRFLDRTDRESL